MILAASSNSELHAYSGLDCSQSIVRFVLKGEIDEEGNIDRVVDDGKMTRTR